jgi:hypothetical protein
VKARSLRESCEPGGFAEFLHGHRRQGILQRRGFRDSRIVLKSIYSTERRINLNERPRWTDLRTEERSCKEAK